MKYTRDHDWRYGRAVAPLAGAWIEILIAPTTLVFSVVAPLAGAWIEILIASAKESIGIGRSPCGSVD